MTEIPVNSDPPRPPRFQFGLSSLLVLTLLVACILSVYRCLGPVYGLLSAIPLGFVAVLILATHWRCAVGTLVGAFILALIGYRWVVGFSVYDPHFAKAMVTLTSYGAAWGAGVHAVLVRRWILGGLLLVISIVVFVVILNVPIEVHYSD
jgi:hypothetical protein